MFSQEVISLLGIEHKSTFPPNSAHTCYNLESVSLLLKRCGKHTFSTWCLHWITYWAHSESPWRHIQTHAVASSCRHCLTMCEINHLIVLSGCSSSTDGTSIVDLRNCSIKPTIWHLQGTHHISSVPVITLIKCKASSWHNSWFTFQGQNLRDGPKKLLIN